MASDISIYEVFINYSVPAGTDTSRQTLKFAILHMIMLPDIQAKVQEEIDKVVGERNIEVFRKKYNTLRKAY